MNRRPVSMVLALAVSWLVATIPVGSAGAQSGPVSVRLRSGGLGDVSPKVIRLFELGLQDGVTFVADDKPPAQGIRPVDVTLTSAIEGAARLMRLRVNVTFPDVSRPPRTFDAVFPDSELFGTVQALSRQILAVLASAPAPASAEPKIRVQPICFKNVGKVASPTGLERLLVYEVVYRLQGAPVSAHLSVRPALTTASVCGTSPHDAEVRTSSDLLLTGVFELSDPSTIRIAITPLSPNGSSILTKVEVKGKTAALAQLIADVTGQLTIDLTAALPVFRATQQLRPTQPTETVNETVDQILGRARDAVARKQTLEAIAIYRRAIQANPKHARARHELALLLRDSGDTTGAIAELSQAQQLEPGLTEVSRALGEALEQQGRVSEAVVVYERALRVAEPRGRPTIVGALARAYVVLGRDDDAIRLLEGHVSGVAKPPADLDALLARAFRNRGDFEQALKHFHRATATEPDDRRGPRRDELLSAYAAYARRKLEQDKDAAAALKLLDRPEYMGELGIALQRPGPVTGQLLLVTGQAMAASQRLADALSVFNGSLESFRTPGAQAPGAALFQLFLAMAQTQLKLGNTESARRSARAAQNQDREHPAPLEMLGEMAEHRGEAADHFYAAARLHEKAGRLEDAIRLYETSLERDDSVSERAPEWRWTRLVTHYIHVCRIERNETLQNLEAWLGRARATKTPPGDAVFALALAYDLAGRDDEAVREYRAFLDGGPENVNALLNLSYVMVRKNELQEARRLIDLARSKGLSAYGHFMADVGLGVVALKTNDTTTALVQLGQAVSKAPNDPVGHVKLGQALLSARQPRDAVKSYQRALTLLGPRSASTLCAKLDPETNVDMDRGLADAYDAAGQKQEAIRHLESVLGYYANVEKWRANIDRALVLLKAAR
jgi:tetratricopeptide (TPR) repeat protein